MMIRKPAEMRLRVRKKLASLVFVPLAKFFLCLANMPCRPARRMTSKNLRWNQPPTWPPTAKMRRMPVMKTKIMVGVSRLLRRRVSMVWKAVSASEPESVSVW